MLPEEIPEKWGWDSESTWLLASLDSSDMTTVFDESLQPSQNTDVLVAIEALTADDVHDRQMGSDIVDTAMTDPASWLTDVPEVLRCIHTNVEQIRAEPARRSLDSLLLLLTKWRPREVVRSLLVISPTCDSAAMAMWEVMISVPWALWRVVSELLGVLQDWRLRRVFSCAADDACIYPLALLVSAVIDDKQFAALYETQRYLRCPSPVMLSLVLAGLMTLSKTSETARKMLVLLPDIMENLPAANSDIRMKALMLFVNVIPHMKREEANIIALRLTEKLPLLFDDESSRVRELSIRLFEDVMKTALGRNTKKMVKKVQGALLPLFFHTNEKIESVAKGPAAPVPPPPASSPLLLSWRGRWGPPQPRGRVPAAPAPAGLENWAQTFPCSAAACGHRAHETPRTLCALSPHPCPPGLCPKTPRVSGPAPRARDGPRNEGGSNPGITPSPQLKAKPRGGGCQVSFPGLWCHLQASASPQASWDTLRACAEFLGWRRLSFLAETGQTPLIGEYLITHKRNSADEYLLQSLPYMENPQASVREAAVRFIGLAARRRRILRLEKLWEICQSALQSLENDAEHSIRCLAAQTVLILTAVKQKPRSGWSLRSLWCCA
ncbi:uncharacterized protein LOC141916925 isoform X2 [Strix aluco]